MVLAVAFLLQSVNGDLESVRRAIDYLILHQAEDGSWGRRPAGCTCPAEPAGTLPPLDGPARARVAALIGRFQDDDPDVRIEAQRSLAAAGPAALPLVREAEATGDAETRTRCRTVIAALQRELTAPDVELTGLTLYLMNEAGYHSKWPRRDGEFPYGPVLQRGQAWLLAQQNAEGRIGPGDACAHAIATLALADELTCTHREDLKEPVRKALHFIAAHRAEDRRGIFWQSAALGAGKMAEIYVGSEAWDAFSDALVRIRAEQPFSASAAASDFLVTMFGRHRRPDLSAEWILNLPPSRMEPETALLISWVAWMIDGNKGPKWKAWIASLGGWLGPRQLTRACGAGAWPGEGTPDRLRRSVLGGLAQQFYYAR